MITTTEFENERAGVMRVKHAKGEAHPLSENGDLLIVYLNGGHIARNEDAKRETIQHKRRRRRLARSFASRNHQRGQHRA